jgi:hypothetical protein
MLAKDASCLGLLAALTVGGCAASMGSRPTPRSAAARVVVEELPDWQRSISLADHERLKGLSSAWAEAIGDVNGAGLKRALSAEGKLLDPAAGLPFPVLSPGNYLCRLVQLGRATGRQRSLTSSNPDFCYVGVDEQGRLWIDKQTGSRQLTGSLYEDKAWRRMIFLGTRKWSRRERSGPYGAPGNNDVVGVLERIGALRYRLAIPRPDERYKLELLELTPAPVQLES